MDHTCQNHLLGKCTFWILLRLSVDHHFGSLEILNVPRNLFGHPKIMWEVYYTHLGLRKFIGWPCTHLPYIFQLVSHPVMAGEFQSQVVSLYQSLQSSGDGVSKVGRLERGKKLSNWISSSKTASISSIESWHSDRNWRWFGGFKQRKYDVGGLILPCPIVGKIMWFCAKRQR